jgi:hypothetical protein
MSSLTIDEVRQHVRQLETHIAATLNDFSDISGVAVEDLRILQVSRFGSATPTYVVQLEITL